MNAVFPTLLGRRPNPRREGAGTTTIYTSRSGAEQRVSWASALRYRYVIPFDYFSDADGDTAAILDLHKSALGAWDSFWLVDPVDGKMRRVRFETDRQDIEGIVSGLWRGDVNLITVSPYTLDSLAVTPTNPSKASGGQTQQFTCTGTLSSAGTLDLTSGAVWASSVAARATITQAGLATTGAQTGAAVISAGFGNLSAQTTLTVT